MEGRSRIMRLFFPLLLGGEDESEGEAWNILTYRGGFEMGSQQNAFRELPVKGMPASGIPADKKEIGPQTAKRGSDEPFLRGKVGFQVGQQVTVETDMVQAHPVFESW